MRIRVRAGVYILTCQSKIIKYPEKEYRKSQIIAVGLYGNSFFPIFNIKTELIMKQHNDVNLNQYRWVDICDIIFRIR